MDSLTNLNKARKARRKAQAARTAVQNRATFGRSKSAKAANAANEDDRVRSERRLDDHRLAECEP